VTTLGWILEAIAAIAIVLLVALRARVRSPRRPRLLVRESAAYRELWLTGGGHATLQSRVSRVDSLVTGIPYTDGFHLYAPAHGDVLFLGGGAAVTPRQFVAFYPEVRVHVVEHDAAVLAVAREQFGLETGERLVVERGDGRAALERPGQFALIVIDAFGAGDFPSSLATVEAFGRARERLIAGGVVAVNLAGRLAGPVLGSVLAGLVEVFGVERTRVFGVPAVGVDPPYDPTRLGNTLAFGFRDAPPASPPGAARASARLPYLGEIAALKLPHVPASAPPLHDDTAPPSLPIG
jgi:spermidine synthase